MTQLICKDLKTGYNGTAVTENINFEVNKGDYLCIVGDNGGGKTTLMKTILGLMPALGGEISLLEDGIGYLPQQTDSQKDFPATVWEIVMSGFEGKRGKRLFANARERAQANANIEKMAISHLKNRSFASLSGGQQQRVLLARALCAADRLLLLDEPVAGLDPQITAEMYRLIEGLNKEGISIIMISHDIQAAMKYSSHILHIGKDVFYGTKRQYIQHMRAGEDNDK